MPSPKFMVSIYTEISRAHRVLGHFNDALEIDCRCYNLERYICASRPRECDPDWDLDNTLFLIASDLSGTGRIQEAIDIWESLLPRREFVDGECSESVLSIPEHFVFADQKPKNFEVARKYLRHAMECRVKNLGYEMELG